MVLVYIISQLMLIAALMVVKKSERSTKIEFEAITGIVSVWVINALLLKLFQLIGIDISVESVSIVDIIIASCILGWIARTKRIQKFEVDLKNILVFGLLIVLAYFVVIKQVGMLFNDFNFMSEYDASHHYMYAQDVANKGELVYQYFSAMNSGLWMDALRGIVPDFYFYIIFIINEYYVLVLNGILFWIIISEFIKSKYLFIIGVFVTAFYMLGHPWNSFIMGTSYLSTGIMLFAYIILLCLWYERGKIGKKYYVLFMLMAIFGMYVSYMLFLPPLFIGLMLRAVYLLYKNTKINKIFLSVFLGMGILIGLYLCYLWLYTDFFAAELGVLEVWGLIYGNFINDFVFIIPFVLYMMYKNCKEKKLDSIMAMFIGLLFFIGLMLMGIQKEKISSYYYFKNYSPLWTLAFVLLFMAISEMDRYKAFLNCYFVTILVMFTAFWFNIEDHFNKSSVFDVLQGNSVNSFVKIYEYNKSKSESRGIKEESLELYYIAAQLAHENDEFIPYIGTYQWLERPYFALAGLEHKDVLEGLNYSQAIEELGKHKYILKMTNEVAQRVRPDWTFEKAVDVTDYLNTLDIYFQNEEGIIYEVN